MLLVKTRLAPSPIAGLGLYADQDIKKGQPTWRFIRGLDLTLAAPVVAMMPEQVREFLMYYAYLHTRTGHYVICADDARFMNHSASPNTIGDYPHDEPEGLDVAVRDIARGEELTCDYLTFDAKSVGVEWAEKRVAETVSR